MADETVVKDEEGVIEGSPTSEEGKETQAELDLKTGVVEKEGKVDGEGEDGEAHKPKHANAQDRIKFFTKKTRTLESNLEAERERNKQLEDEKNQTKDPDIPFPDRDDFENQEDYKKAVNGYMDAGVEARVKKSEEKRSIEANRDVARKSWDGFNKLADQLDPEKYPDLDDALVGKGTMYSDFSREFVKTSQLGPQLAYYFYQNPDIAEKIGSLGMAQASQELISIQANLTKAGSSKTRTNAPAPIDPIGGTNAISNKDPEKMTPDEWLAWRNENKKIR